jgi:hypothetical protein
MNNPTTMTCKEWHLGQSQLLAWGFYPRLNGSGDLSATSFLTEKNYTSHLQGVPSKKQQKVTSG